VILVEVEDRHGVCAHGPQYTRHNLKCTHYLGVFCGRFVEIADFLVPLAL
jgi:hypothetical protein